MAHALDEMEYAQKLSLIRTVSLGMIVVLLVVSVGFAMVVFYALGGIALAGNLYSVGGVSVLAIVMACLTPVVPAVAMAVGRNKRRALVAKMAGDHPEVVGPEADTERLLNAFAGGQFAESAVVFAAALAFAVVFHVISSPVLLACIGVLVAWLVVRFPFTARVRGWFDAEVAALGRRRATSSGTRPR